MFKVGQILTEKEKEVHGISLNSEGQFAQVLKSENLDLGQGIADTLAVYYYASDESSKDFGVKETSELVEFGENLKVILTVFEDLKTQKKGYITKIWKLDGTQLTYKEFNNKDLEYEYDIAVEDQEILVKAVTEHFPVYKKSEEISSLWYDPASCIVKGSCCSFEGKTYQHCGQYCGSWENKGGGAVLNELDRCCLNHDACLMAGRDRCACHNEFLDCAANKVGPGDTTIRNGIRGAKVLDGCYW
jgi:hypothetical protein